MKKLSFLFILVSICTQAQTEKDKINLLLNNWHLAATKANFNDYMNAMTTDAVYIGTDASENWTKFAFMAFAKPYFDKGKAWSFTTLERHIYISKDAKTAWFDELLDTQMKICRGSGVLLKVNKQWKIQHYVLSMTIPNENSSEVITAKTALEDKLINTLKKDSVLKN